MTSIKISYSVIQKILSNSLTQNDQHMYGTIMGLKNKDTDTLYVTNYYKLNSFHNILKDDNIFDKELEQKVIKLNQEIQPGTYKVGNIIFCQESFLYNTNTLNQLSIIQKENTENIIMTCNLSNINPESYLKTFKLNLYASENS